MTQIPMLDGPSAAPVSGGRPRSLVIFLHGYGSNGADLIDLAPYWAQALPDIQALRRGILWRLWLPGSDAGEARRLAEKIAATRSRREGLLANPHAQTCEVLHVVSGPRAAS